MQGAAASPLAGWDSFYVIMGSSAAALTGLQFVVAALVADSSRRRPSEAELGTYATPTVVHFCIVLLLSAILSAPWPVLSDADIAVGACGAGGVVYAAVVTLRTRRRSGSGSGYRPVMEDWIWYVVLPWIAYAAILIAAVTLPADPTAGLFTLAASALLLLFIGIHNAWDTATYIATMRPLESDAPAD